MHNVMNTYRRLPVEFTHGEGIWLYDSQGRRYLDALSGIAVCGLGHAHPAVTQAIRLQAEKLLHVSNLFQIPNQERLAELLCKVSGLDTVFFCNSGAEANEAAIKLARLHGHRRGIDNPAIVVMEGAFHGRTLATLSASGNRAIQAGFEPLVKGFVRAPFNDLAALDTIARNNHEVVAILVEPIQGESGIKLADANYLAELRRHCDQHGWLLMLDEVQTGNGRSGSYFAYQNRGILPDVVTTAKGLGNGVPIGACLAGGAAATLFQPGNHGSTFGGNPLATAAARAVVSTIDQQQLAANAGQIGERLLAGFRSELTGCDSVRDIRGEGLLLGIELSEPCAEFPSLCAAQGVIVNVTADRVIRLLPPLIMTADEADQLIERLVRLIKTHAADERTKPRS